MRILIVSQYFWPEGFRINEIAKSLVEAGVEVDVLTGNPNYPEGQVFPGYSAMASSSEPWQGTTIFRVPTITRGTGKALRRIFNYLSFVIFGCLIGPWLLRKRKYDVIFVYAVSPIFQAIPAVLLSGIKKCPLTIWVQDLWPESLDAMGVIRNKNILYLIGLGVRAIYHYTDLILTQSQAFIPAVKRLAPKKKILYYPNSVESFFADKPSIENSDARNLVTDFSIVFAGNIGIGQAVEVIVEAATMLKDYKDIKFVVIGQGSRWEWMRQQVQEKQLSNLLLPGRFPVETMPSFMQRASALLVTLSDQPIFALTVPNKIQAYMAAGRPILACLNGEGARLVVEAGAGLAVPSENAKELANAVLKLYQMELREREEMGQNGRRYYQQHFDHDTLIGDLISHFKLTIEEY